MACFIVRKFQEPHVLLSDTSKRSCCINVTQFFSTLFRKSLLQICILNHIHSGHCNVCFFVIHVCSLLLCLRLSHPRGLFPSCFPTRIQYKNPPCLIFLHSALHDAIILIIKCSKVKIINSEQNTCRAQWLCSLMHKSLAARLLDCGFDSRRRHGCLCLVNVEFTGKSLCDGPIPHPEESY